MNISKKILSLGLIAVISGVSTAQTYTATAGTNGITDIQSDYSMSTGDGASVSVDVPLEFELPKKVAIAVKDSSGTFTSNPLFSTAQFAISPINATSTHSGLLTIAHPSDPVYSYLTLQVTGAIYSNTDNVSVIADMPVEFIHETDPNSKISHTVWGGYTDEGALGFEENQVFTNWKHTAASQAHSLDFSSEEDNIKEFNYHTRLLMSTIDATDRAGRYTNTLTFTVNVL